MRTRFAKLFPIVGATLVLMVSSAHAATPGLAQEIEEAVELLLASVRAEESARQDFQRLVERGALDPGERRDYEVYLDELARMVEENRARLMELSHEVDAAAAAPGRVSLEAEAPPTTDERVAALDADLGASLSEFDELLLNEMERVRRQSEAPAEAHTAESAAEGGAQGGQPEQGGDGESADSAEGDSGAGGNAGAEAGTVAGGAEGTEGSGAGAGAGPGATGEAGSQGGGEAADAGVSTGGGTGGGTPTDIADASDDDVVARQLREAAERETDPALKERLWEEYRRYKSGARSGGGEGR